MIVAIAGTHPDPLATLLGERLATLRRRAGCTVLLLDAAQDASRAAGDAARAYDDVLIDACACRADACCAALDAAQVALVPLAPGEADTARHYDLIARLNAARMRNPGLRVLFVAAGAGAAPDADDLEAVRAYAREVMSGHVARTVLAGANLLEADGAAAAGLDALGREVFGKPA
jgi:chromosome partitioning protein